MTRRTHPCLGCGHNDPNDTNPFRRPRRTRHKDGVCSGPGANDPDESFVPAPVGFTAHLRDAQEPRRAPDREPLLWDGDQA